MFKYFINLDTKWTNNFRKSYLEEIHRQISSGKERVCCMVKCKQSVFICWKDLKEVQDNMDSEFLRIWIRQDKREQNCSRVWFVYTSHRLEFLKECLDKF